MLEEILKKTAAAATLLSISGCVTLPLNPLYEAPVAKSATVNDNYKYYKHDIKVNKVLKNENFQYIKYSCNFEHDGHSVKFYYYQVKSKRKTPLIIISPILEGSYRISKLFAELFAYQGLSSVIMLRATRVLHETHSGKDIERLTVQSLEDSRRIIDWMEKQPEINADQIGAFGISMGGIKTALLASIDDRIKCSVISIAGSDIPNILISSKESSVVIYRKARTQKQSIEEFRQELENNLHSDPKFLAKYINADNALMFISLFDQCVPTKYQFELYKRIGGPETVLLPTGHYTSMIAVPYVWIRASRFFKMQFSRNSSKLFID